MSIEIVPKIYTIKIHDGSKLSLAELSLLDIADGESVLGIPSEKWFPQSQQENEHEVGLEKSGPGLLLRVATVLWLASRKVGLTQEQILARKWPASREQFMMRLSLADVNSKEVQEAIGKCFSGGE